MSKNQAIVVQRAGEAKVIDVSAPRLRDDYILVKTKAIALNPTDWKHIDFIAPPGTRVSAENIMPFEDQSHNDFYRLDATMLALLRKSEAKSQKDSRKATKSLDSVTEVCPSTPESQNMELISKRQRSPTRRRRIR